MGRGNVHPRSSLCASPTQVAPEARQLARVAVVPLKPKSHAERMRDADPARRGRRVFDDAYRRARNDRALHPLEAEAEAIRRSPRWRRLREYMLRCQPLCAECLRHDIARVATDVDHIEPIIDLLARGDRERAFDPANLQSLCRSDHNQKTAAERRARRPRLTPPSCGNRGAMGIPRANAIKPNVATHSDLYRASTRGSTNPSNDQGAGVISRGNGHAGGRAPVPHFSRVSPPFAHPDDPSQVPPASEVTPADGRDSRTPESDPR